MARMDSNAKMDSGARMDQPDTVTHPTMAQNLISETMTDTQRDAMLADLDAFEVKFTNYKCLLTPAQIRRLSKLDAEDLALLKSALTFAQQNPGCISAEIDVPELAKDIALAEQLVKVNAKAQQKANTALCSTIAVLSDSYFTARLIYRTQKALGRNPTNAEFLDQFGDHFGRGPQTPPTPPTP